MFLPLASLVFLAYSPYPIASHPAIGPRPDNAALPCCTPLTHTWPDGRTRTRYSSREEGDMGRMTNVRFMEPLRRKPAPWTCLPPLPQTRFSWVNPVSMRISERSLIPGQVGIRRLCYYSFACTVSGDAIQSCLVESAHQSLVGTFRLF